jgi:hypothetical protein
MARAASLVLPLVALVFAAPPALAVDLARIDRRVGKEPRYQSKPKYCLLALGPEAKHRAWLVLDGQTLYVDRSGTGDLTRPDCRVARKAEPGVESLFEAGDLTVGGQRYAGLQVRVLSAKNNVGEAQAQMPMFRDFLAAQPDGKLHLVSIEVPLARPLRDVRDGSLLKVTRHFAGEYDAAGILQFADRPERAPVIHLGGAWTLWPDGQQQLVRGRSEDLTLKLGTPGHGPGTFACICYDFLIPASARPHVRIEYPAPPGKKAIVRSHALEDRC